MIALILFIFLIESTEHYHQIHFESTGSMWVLLVHLESLTSSTKIERGFTKNKLRALIASLFVLDKDTKQMFIQNNLIAVPNYFIFWLYWWLIRIISCFRIFASLQVMFRGGVRGGPL